jgi:tight adherence protein B
MDTTAQLALGAFLLASALAVAGVLTYAAGRSQKQALIERLSTAGGEYELPSGPRRHFSVVDRQLRRTRFGRRVQLKLATTGLDVTPGEFAVYVLVLVTGLWLVSAAVLAPFFGPVSAVLGLLAANAFLTHQRTRRTEEFINQLPELSRILANATSAGLALRTALGMAAEELDAPAGDELTLVTNQLALGRSIEDALGELAERLPSRELVVLVTTLVLANRAAALSSPRCATSPPRWRSARRPAGRCAPCSPRSTPRRSPSRCWGSARC